MAGAGLSWWVAGRPEGAALTSLAPLILRQGLSAAALFGTIADGLLRLARLRLFLDRPAEAVSALDSLKLVGVEPDAEASARLRVLAFLRLDRIDDALASGADAEAWLEGLAAVANKPFAARVVTAIEFSFGAAMTEEQFARLEALRRRVAPPGPPDEPVGSADPKEPVK